MEATILLLSNSEERTKQVEAALANASRSLILLHAQSKERVNQLLSQSHPEILLIDQNFDYDTIVEVLEKFRSRFLFPQVPSILMVSQFDCHKVSNLMRFGIEDFVLVPFSPERLVLRVEMSIDRSRWISKLVQQSEKFSYVAQAANMAGNSLLIINSKGEISWANDGFEKLYECSLEEFKASFGNNLFDPSMKQPTLNAMLRCRDTGQTITYEVPWCTPGGVQKYIQTSLTPIYDPDGSFSKIIAIETDITELKHVEETLMERNDHLLTLTEHLEKANEMLEEQQEQIESQKESLEQEVKKSETLLQAILPATAAHQLKKKGFVKPKKYREATVIFADFVGFTRISSMYEEIEDLLDVLGFYFEVFDEITTTNYLEKIKTIGDCYMCVGGVPQSNKSHPFDAIVAALKMQQFVEEQAQKSAAEGKPIWRIRIGIHTGPLVGGVIGNKRFAYDIWGDTVNLASRMETASDPGMVNISQATHEYIKQYVDCNYRGKFPAKNIGEIDMFYVQRIKPEYSEDPEGYIPNAELKKIISAL